MQHEVVRAPKTPEKMVAIMNDYAAYMEAMYTEENEAIHGPLDFKMDHWVFLWTQGSGFFLTSKLDTGELRAVIMCTQTRDMWNDKHRIDMVRYAILGDEVTWEQHKESAIEYLEGISGILGIDEIYVSTHLAEGSELKELVWRKDG